MNKILLSELIAAVAAQEHSQTTCELSTLNENEDLTTIAVDKTVQVGDFCVITLSYNVMLENDQDVGGLVCSGLDPNTDNTALDVKLDNVLVTMDGEDYSADELRDNFYFKSEILASPMNDLTPLVVDGLLKQILPEYAVSSI